MKITPTGKFTCHIFPFSEKTIEITPEEYEFLKNKEYCFNENRTAVIPYVPTAEEIEAKYKKAVIDSIRTKYTADDEIAILRQKEEKPAEYQAYFDFCEQCKAEAKGGTTM